MTINLDDFSYQFKLYTLENYTFKPRSPILYIGDIELCNRLIKTISVHMDRYSSDGTKLERYMMSLDWFIVKYNNIIINDMSIIDIYYLVINKNRLDKIADIYN